MVRHFAKQGLVGGIFAPQGVEADLVSVQINFGAHQPMCPVLSHGEDFAEQMGTSIIVGATQEDQGAAHGCIRMKLERLRKRVARAGACSTGSATRAVSGDVEGAGGPQLGEVLEVMALPDFGLPTTR